MKNGIELIAEERERQIKVEGWTAEHDDKHDCGELSAAGACYADLASIMARGASAEEIKFVFTEWIDGNTRWPWDEKWFKPSGNNIRNLARAGALIAAEIDRLQRMQS